MISADIATSRLVLSCLDAEHVTDDYRRWMSDPEVTRFLETRFATPSSDSLRDYVAAMRASSNQYFFGIFEGAQRKHIGNIKLGPISPVHERAAIGLVIGDKGAWGRGYAGEAIGAITDWGFGELELQKISAGSYQTNIGSIRAFQRNGFQIEGIQRSHVALADGGRDDVVVLGRTRTEWAEMR